MNPSEHSATIACLLTRVPRALQLDAQVIIADAMQCSRAHVLAHPEKPVNAACANRIEERLARRCSGEPIAYILGRREFFGLELEVNASVLVPRPDTELLVEQCLMQAAQGARILDLGTGSGAIAIALKHSRPDLILSASDINPKALAVAQRNAEQHRCEIRWCRSNWFESFAEMDIAPRFELIVSNPPYIAEGDSHLARLGFEPQGALLGGADGLDAYKIIANEARAFLAPDGLLLLEHGAQQAHALTQLLTRHDFVGIKTHDDLAGLPRVTQARMAPTTGAS